jgi:hypothetical protein
VRSHILLAFVFFVGALLCLGRDMTWTQIIGLSCLVNHYILVYMYLKYRNDARRERQVSSVVDKGPC